MAYIGRSVDIGNFEKQVLTPDSSTTTFTLSFGVGSANSLLVVYGGVIQEPNVAYAISGGGLQIVFSEAPVTGTTLYIVYLGKQMLTPRAAGQETTKQTFSGDGTTTLFTLTDPPVVPAGIMVFVDGILQREGSGNNFVSSGSTINFSAAPDSGAEIDVYTLVKEKVSIDTVADGSITRTKLAQSAPYWDANGYVGIGDATPTSTGYKLSIKDSSAPFIGMTGTANGAHALALFRTAQSSGGQIGVVDTAAQQIVGSAIGDMIVRTNTSNSKILFSTDTGATSTLTITGGKVGVGTNTPAAKFSVAASGVDGIQLAQDAVSNNSGRLFFSTATTNQVIMAVDDATSPTPRITYRTGASFGSTSGSERLNFSQYGLALTTTTNSDGMGIKFPASQIASTDPNTLDDYEEGTWDPTFAPISGTGFTSISYNTAFTKGRYVKVGNLVTVTGYIRTEALNKGSATTTVGVIVGGLPFTSGNTGTQTEFRSVGSVAAYNWISNAPNIGYVGNGANYIELLTKGTVGSGNGLISTLVSDMGTGANYNIVQFGISYIVA